MTGKQLHIPLHDSGDPIDLTGNTSPTNNGATDSVYGLGGLTAYSFDGTDDYVDLGTDIFSSDSYTLCAWVRLREKSSDSHFIDLEGLNRIKYNNSSDALTTRHFDKSKTTVVERGSITPSTHKWYHVVSTYDSSDELLKIYVNGVEDKSESGVSPSQIDTFNRSSGIGSSYDGSDTYTNGSIADVRIYDRTLSASEVEALYQMGSGDYTRQSLHDGSDSGAVSRYTLDSDADDSWGSNGGTLQGGASVGNSNSVYSGSLSLNGTDQRVRLPQIQLQSHTISVWVNPDGVSNLQQVIRGTEDNSSYGYAISIGSGHVDYGVKDGSAFFIGGSGVSDISSDNWYHLTGSYDGSTIRLYINGTVVDSGSTTKTLQYTGTNSYIGHDGGGQELWYDGNIDDVRIYDRALSPTEVRQLYREKHGQDMAYELTKL